MIEVARILPDRTINILGEITEDFIPHKEELRAWFPFDGTTIGRLIPYIHEDTDTIWNSSNIVVAQLYPVDKPGAYDTIVMQADIFLTAVPTERFTVLRSNVSSYAMYLSIDSSLKVSVYNHNKVSNGYHASVTTLELYRKYTITHINSRHYTAILIDGVIDRVFANENEIPTTINSVMIGAETAGRTFKGEISNIKIGCENIIPVLEENIVLTEDGFFLDAGTTNLIPLEKNRYPSYGNGHGTYQTNQYVGDGGSNTPFVIGTLSGVTDNIITLATVAHPIYDYDVIYPTTSGGGLTAGTNYFIKKISDTQFTIHAYNNSQDGSQGYIVPGKGFKVHQNIWDDVRVPVNATDFPLTWRGGPHLPNSGLVKEVIPFGYKDISDCLRMHRQHKKLSYNNSKDYMAYGVLPPVVAGQTYTFSFEFRAVTPESLGVEITPSFYTTTSWTNYLTSRTITLNDHEWHRLEITAVAPASGSTNMYFPFSKDATVDIANIQCENLPYGTQFTGKDIRSMSKLSFENLTLLKNEFTMLVDVIPSIDWDSTIAGSNGLGIVLYGTPGSNGFVVYLDRSALTITLHTYAGAASDSASYAYGSDPKFVDKKELNIGIRKALSDGRIHLLVDGVSVLSVNPFTNPTSGEHIKFQFDEMGMTNIGGYKNLLVFGKELTTSEIQNIIKKLNMGLSTSGDMYGAQITERGFYPKDSIYFPLDFDGIDEFGIHSPTEQAFLEFDDDSVFITLSGVNVTYGRMGTFSANAVMTRQENGTLTLTAQGTSEYIGLNSYDYTPVAGDTIFYRGILKRNGKPVKPTSVMSIYNNATPIYQEFNDETGEFFVITPVVSNTSWLFWCSFAEKVAGDIFTFENLHVEKRSIKTPFLRGTNGASKLKYKALDNLINLEEGTMGIMFKPTAEFFNNVSWNRVFGHATAVNKNEIQVKRNSLGNNLVMSVSNDAGSPQTSWSSLPTQDLVADKWYLVIARWSKSQGVMKLTLNDQTSEQPLAAGYVPTVRGNIAIGYHDTLASRYSNSYFRDFFILQRMITDDEVSDIYNKKFSLEEDYVQFPQQINERGVLE